MIKRLLLCIGKSVQVASIVLWRGVGITESAFDMFVSRTMPTILLGTAPSSTHISPSHSYFALLTLSLQILFLEYQRRHSQTFSSASYLVSKRQRNQREDCSCKYTAVYRSCFRRYSCKCGMGHSGHSTGRRNWEMPDKTYESPTVSWLKNMRNIFLLMLFPLLRTTTQFNPHFVRASQALTQSLVLGTTKWMSKFRILVNEERSRNSVIGIATS
jgi:hypothetical protein